MMAKKIVEQKEILREIKILYKTQYNELLDVDLKKTLHSFNKYYNFNVPKLSNEEAKLLEGNLRFKEVSVVGKAYSDLKLIRV